MYISVYQVGVWGTQELHSSVGSGVLDTVATFLEEGANRAGKDLNAQVKSLEVPTPIERPKVSFTVPNPCYNNINTTYDSLVGWWTDYGNCNVSNLEVDSNLLVTNATSGGVAWGGGKYAVANGHEIPAWRDTYTNSAPSSKEGAKAMVSCMHETGHNLMKSGLSDPDEDNVKHHDTGTAYDAPAGISATPMSSGGYFGNLENGNECLYNPPGTSYERFAFRWSNCCQGKWQKK